MSCVNTRIKSLKVWLRSILPRLKYSIFSMGLFFICSPSIWTAGVVMKYVVNRHACLANVAIKSRTCDDEIIWTRWKKKMSCRTVTWISHITMLPCYTVTQKEIRQRWVTSCDRDCRVLLYVRHPYINALYAQQALTSLIKHAHFREKKMLWNHLSQIILRRVNSRHTVCQTIAEITLLFINLARSANLPTGLYILPSVSFFFFKLSIMSKAISGSTGPIFTIFYQMKGICVNVVNPDQLILGNFDRRQNWPSSVFALVF